MITSAPVAVVAGSTVDIQITAGATVNGDAGPFQLSLYGVDMIHFEKFEE